MGLVLLVHAAVIFGAPWQKPDDIAVPVTLQLDIAANGEPAHARQQVDEQPSDAQVGEIMPVATPPSEQESAAAEAVVPQAAAEAKPAEQTSPSPNAETSPPPPEAQAMAPAEQVPADVDRQATVGVSSPAIPPEELHPDAPAQAQTPPREPSAEQPRQSPNSPAREIQREEQRKEEQAEKRKAQQAEKLKEQAEERKRAAAAAPARVASRAGTETGRGETGSATGSVSAADYGRLVYAEIARHSHYPESAAPATGTVVLSFTIGSSGRVTSSSVVRSSGNGLLDGAARQTMSAVSLPPPPGGRYSNTVPIHLRPH
jgi:protein TonB